MVMSASGAESSAVPSNRAPYSVLMYMTLRGDSLFLYAYRYWLMPYLDRRHFDYEQQLKEELLTDVGTQERRWKKLERLGATDLRSVGSHADSPFVCCIEERRYKSAFPTLAESDIPVELDMNLLLFCLVCFDRSLSVRSQLNEF